MLFALIVLGITIAVHSITTIVTDHMSFEIFKN